MNLDPYLSTIVIIATISVVIIAIASLRAAVSNTIDIVKMLFWLIVAIAASIAWVVSWPVMWVIRTAKKASRDRKTAKLRPLTSEHRRKRHANGHKFDKWVVASGTEERIMEAARKKANTVDVVTPFAGIIDAARDTFSYVIADEAKNMLSVYLVHMSTVDLFDEINRTAALLYKRDVHSNVHVGHIEQDMIDYKRILEGLGLNTDELLADFNAWQPADEPIVPSDEGFEDSPPATEPTEPVEEVATAEESQPACAK